MSFTHQLKQLYSSLGLRALCIVAALCTSSLARAETITIFAAASMGDAVNALADQYSRDSGHTIRTSFASSSVLARQIISGAPADVFISANTAWMDEADSKGAIIAASRRIIAGNRLVLVASSFVTLPLAKADTISADYPLARIMAGQRLALGDPGHVPSGIYARQSLEALGLWEPVREQLVPMPSVRAALAMVERGEVSLGVVYASDIRYASGVQLIGNLPDDSHAPIRYPAAVVTGHQRPAVTEFMVFLISPQATKVLTEHGFRSPIVDQ